MNWRWSLRLTRRISFTKEDEQVLYASVSAMPQSPATKNPNSAVDLAVRPLAEAGDGPNRLKPTYVVEAGKLLSSHPKELWAYRELFLLLVKRDFVGAYKQTVLGPLWFFVQPFLASVVFMVVFGQIARLPTTELPPLVFYMSGIIAWNFFCKLPDPSFLHVSRERRSVPENLLPEVVRPLEPGQYELLELFCSTARALRGDCVLRT